MHINTNFSSPNYSPRVKPIEYIMVHFTEMTFEAALEKLISEESQLSAHYLIKADGEIFQLVEDEYIAWHSGISFWHGCEALNQNSIGIELDNLGNCAFPKAQMDALIELSHKLLVKHDIKRSNFIAHSDVAPDRKIDPGIFFDWKLYASSGLGIWHDLTDPKFSEVLHQFGDSSDEIKILQQSLSKLGYAIDISGIMDKQTNFVIRSFKSKFYPKPLQDKGIESYFNDESRYNWCSFSEKILHRLLQDT